MVAVIAMAAETTLATAVPRSPRVPVAVPITVSIAPATAACPGLVQIGVEIRWRRHWQAVAVVHVNRQPLVAKPPGKVFRFKVPGKENNVVVKVNVRPVRVARRLNQRWNQRRSDACSITLSTPSVATAAVAVPAVSPTTATAAAATGLARCANPGGTTSNRHARGAGAAAATHG